MHVVLDAADGQRLAAHLCKDTDEIGVQSMRFGLQDKWFSVLGGEDRMHVNLSERLRHAGMLRASQKTVTLLSAPEGRYSGARGTAPGSPDGEARGRQIPPLPRF